MIGIFSVFNFADGPKENADSRGDSGLATSGRESGPANRSDIDRCRRRLALEMT